jgi:hypothetical protein
MLQVNPDITAVINSSEMIPPGRKVIKPIPLRKYRAIKPIREIKNMLGNMVLKFPMLSRTTII